MSFGQEAGLLFKVGVDPSSGIAGMQRLEASVKSSVSNIISAFPGGGFLSPFVNELTRGSTAFSTLGGDAKKLREQLSILEGQAEKIKNRFSDFNESLRINFAGKVDTDFLKQFRAAEDEAAKFKLLSKQFGADAANMFTPIEKTAFQFAKLERDGTAALSSIQGKAGKVTQELATLEGGTASSGAGFAAMAGPVGIAAGALIVGTGAAIGVTKALFDLTAQTAETEGHLFDLSQKLNFTVETLSAVSIAAQTSGSDIDGISTAFGIFDKNVTKVNDGSSKQLLATFKALHIDTRNNETALRDAFKALAALDEGERQTALAMQLFGKSGKDVLGVIKEMGGDIDGATKKFAEMGILISGDAARAADRYGDQWKMLDLRFEASKRIIGEELMPVFFQLSDALSQNAGDMSLVRDVTKTYITEVGLLKDAVLDAIPGLSTYLQLRRALGGDVTGAKVAGDAIPAQGGIKATQPVALPTADPEEMSKMAFRLANEEAARTEKSTTAELQRQLQERRISIDAFTRDTIKAAQVRLDAETNAITKRREAVEQEKPKDEAERKKIFEDQLKLAHDLQAAQDAFNDAKKAAESNQRREHEKAQRDHEQSILNIQIQSYSNQVERIRAQIQDGIVTRAAGYQVIAQLEDASYEKQKAFFEKQRAAAGADAAMWQQYTDRLKTLEVSRTKTAEEQARRRIEARTHEAEDELNRQLANFKRDNEVRDAQDRQRIAQIKAAIDARVKAEDEGEREIAAIQDKAADRRMDADLARLRFQLKNLTNDPSKKQDVDQLSTVDLIKQASAAADTVGTNQKEIATLETIRDLLAQLKTAAIERAAATEDASRRIAAVGDKEIAAMMRRTQSTYDLEKELEQGQRDLDRSRYQRELESSLSSMKQRQAAIAWMTQLDLEDADERKRHTDAQINADEQLMLREAENEAQRLLIKQQFNEKRLQADQAYQDERKRIQQKGDADVEREDPTSGRSLFGDTYANAASESGSKLVGFGATAVDVFHKASAAAGNMKSMFADAFGSAVSGIQDMTKQWILYGTAGPNALRKMTASILAGLAAQAIGKALWEGAEALAEYAIGISLAANPFTAALAPGHFAAAAAHTTAAIAYGALGGASALLGRAVAGSAFSSSGASAGSGSVAGSAFGSGSGASNNDPRVITENRSQWQQPAMPSHPEPQRIDLHLHVSGQVDNAKMVEVVAQAIDPNRGLPNKGMHDAVINVITHEYQYNNPRLTGMFEHASGRW
jgi:hypothetical protein